MADRYEVVIVGGGMAGMLLGCALVRAGVSTAVIERTDSVHLGGSDFDGRTTSIAYGSAQVLKGIGIWPLLEMKAEPILDIRVADGHPYRGVSPLFLHYDHAEVGQDPFGYIIENRAIRAALFRYAVTLPGLKLIAPVEVEMVDRTLEGVFIKLGNGESVTASLIVGADGRNSSLRQSAGIQVTEFAYDQTAIVCTVTHERDHAGVAVELFLPGGPFAMLPMTEQRTNVVWTEKTELVPTFLELDEAGFLGEVGRRFGNWLGEIELVGPKFSYPLGLMHAARYTDLRLALISEAAHVVHPIAGQGFNLGIRDIAALAEAIVDAARLGLEPSDPSVLNKYEAWRRTDNLTLAVVTDLLNRLFSNDVPPIRAARDLGLVAVGKMPPLKRFLMKHAMGVLGELPRLVRGRPL